MLGKKKNDENLLLFTFECLRREAFTVIHGDGFLIDGFFIIQSGNGFFHIHTYAHAKKKRDFITSRFIIIIIKEVLTFSTSVLYN